MLTSRTDYLDAMERTRIGLLATPALLKQFDWKIGDTVTLRSRELQLDGSGDWTFNIVGTFDSVVNPDTATFAVINYSYLDESRVANRGTVERFYVRIADPKRSIATAAAIDAVFANSSHETRTRSDQERAEADTKQMGDIAFFTNAVLISVLFTLLFLTSNTLRQSVQDRLSEFGVLKAVGFTGARCFRLVLAEALSLYLFAALIGLALAAVAAPFARDIAVVRVSPAVVVQAISIALMLSLLSVALPSWRVYRISVVESLAGH
jgi:putative ABC transport system permease protein